MKTVTPIREFSQSDLDTALLAQLGVCVIELGKIPVEDLVELSYGESSAYMTLYGAIKMIEEKLYQMAVYINAKRFEQDLIENGRLRP